MKTSELTGVALDWAVCKAKGQYQCPVDEYTEVWMASRRYSTDWALGGPIIDREGITTAFCSGDLGEPRSYWIASIETQSWEYGYGPYHEQEDVKSLRICKPDVVKGPTPLIAAMRCYVASKLGDEVEIPQELL